MKTSSNRMRSLAPHFFAGLNACIQELRAAGHDVIRLDVGSPDLPPAAPIIEALAHSAASPDRHGYQPHRGPGALRAAWAQMYARLYGLKLDPETEIVPLLGSKEGIFNLVMACIDPGDLVLIPDPGYVTYTRATLFAGGEPYYLPLLPELGYVPDLDAIPPEILRRARMLWLNYPNNPTAATATLEFFTDAIALGEQHDLLVCHDAAYTQVTYDGYQAPSILQAPGAKAVAVEFNTLSKSHNMAGWRVGAAIGQVQALRSLYTLKTNLDSGHFLPIMEAATAALSGDQGWLRERNAIYQQRRDVVIRALHALGLAARVPRASLYVWSPIPEGWSSMDFAAELLEKAHVSLTPGTVFGAGGEGFVRISLTAPEERLEEAMERLKVALSEMRRKEL
ncbi:MAG: aminotransferase class I/II-fold pyridoxal phosphate-dependent enzyme [Anaerolineales bacterium]